MSTLARLESLSHSPLYKKGTRELPILNELAIRYADERPFAGVQVVFGHILVLNAIASARVLAIGGADITFCDPFPSPVTQRIAQHLQRCDIPVLSVENAVQTSDIFLDVAAVLGQHLLPSRVAELSRSGDRFYEHQPCTTVSIDGSQAKQLECFFGTGDGMVRAWQQFKPNLPLANRHIIQFGYGKVGRGVAWRLRQEHARMTLVECPGKNYDLARAEGFDTLLTSEDSRLEKNIADAEVIVAVSGIPNAVADNISIDWINASQPILVSLSAVDEFGEAIAPERVLGGKGKPLNFHLDSPTANRYIDPSLAGHLLALEEVIHNSSDLKPGLNRLSVDSDRWLLSRWQHHWPNEPYNIAFPKVDF